MGHIVGITGLATTNFHDVPPMQRLKSSEQNQCLWCLNDHYDFVPKNLNKMEQEFHLQICKG
jgi:hypothetical protein